MNDAEHDHLVSLRGDGEDWCDGCCSWAVVEQCPECGLERCAACMRRAHAIARIFDVFFVEFASGAI